MAKPPKSQVLLEVKVVEKSADPSSKGQKRGLILTPHRLWIAEGRDMILADLRSVQLTAPDTVAVLRIGRSKPTEFRCRKADDASRLRACLVFHAKTTHGGIPGVEMWTQLMHAPYDQVDITDTAAPAAASPLIDTASAIVPTATKGAGGRASTVKIAVIIAAVAITATATVTYVMIRSSGKSTRQAGNSQGLAETIRLADDAMGAGEYVRAEKLYRAALAESPRSSQLNAALGKCLFYRNRPTQAITALEDAIKYGTGNRVDVPVMLATCYLDTGDASNAYLVLQRARREFPDDVDLDYLMARTYMARKDFDEARKLSSRVYRLQPDNTENARMHATLLDQAGQYREATPVYLALARRTKDYGTFIKAVLAAGKSNNLRQAGRIVSQARAAIPGHPALVGKTNDDVLIALGVMEKPPEPEPEPEPTEPVEPGTDVPPDTTTPDDGTEPGEPMTPDDGTEPGEPMTPDDGTDPGEPTTPPDNAEPPADTEPPAVDGDMPPPPPEDGLDEPME